MHVYASIGLFSINVLSFDWRQWTIDVELKISLSAHLNENGISKGQKMDS